MAAPRYLNLVSGGLQQVATVAASAGAGDAEKIPSLDTNGRLDLSLLPAGTGPVNEVIATSEDLAASDLVNIWDDSGTLKVRKADADGSKPADGYVLAAVTTGNNATVYFEGEITGLTSLTLGAYYFLSATAGGVTATPPSTATHISQRIGKATSATTLMFTPEPPVTLA